MFNPMSNPTDTRKILTGKDGRLFIYGTDGNSICLFTVPEFHIALDWQTTETQFVGNLVTTTVLTGVKPSLNFNEVIVSDEATFGRILDDLNNERTPMYDFQGLVGIDETHEQRVVCRECVPTGTMNLQDVVPGSILQRTFSFAINQLPEVLKRLTA